MSHVDRARTLKALLAIVLASAIACSGDANPGRSAGHKPGSGPSPDQDSGSDMFGNAIMHGDGGVGAHDGGGEVPLDTLLMLVPDMPTLRLELGHTLDTLQFKVTTKNGTAVDAKFRVEDGSFGSIDEHGVFTPSGKRGGSTFIEARVGATVLRTELTIDLTWEQSGAPADPNAGMSSGGYAGVGGEGPGGAPSKDVRTALDSKPQADAALKWLYPYDGTVFPLGLLAPLLMWSEGTAAVADGALLHVSGDHFDYHGYFGRPPALAGGAAFVRHPIPQDVWDAATQTVAGGSALTVELTLAKDGKAYGPITQHLKIASGRLKGTVYYQSYGTNLAKNLSGAIGGDGMFGGATLAIKPGATSPELVAGATGDMGKCRVCHSVSSDGSRMTVEHGDDYDVTSSYDLRNGYTETGYPDADRSQLAWIGMTPDGKIGLANGEPLAVQGDPISQLYDMDTGDVIASSGLSDFVREAAFPAFAHDGKMVAFNFWSGPGNSAIGAGDGKKLVAMDFDPMTRAFGNPQLLYSGDLAAGWPSFSPTGNSVVFELEINRGSEDKFFYTRYGGRGELWWTNLETGKAHRMENVNGGAYLPTGADNHDNDQQLNYEPTIAPIASGGYAWMVFTSRRLYGNVATIDPWFSDPREHDLTTTPTTKKLWVAAIDLDVTTPEFNVEVGDDPSHPAFYLPGQELLAGNTRGFWVVDPCKADGKSCESGVDCCSGYCQAEEDSTELTCGKKTSDCSNEYERCETRADCCDPKAACINHVCTMLHVD